MYVYVCMFVCMRVCVFVCVHNPSRMCIFMRVLTHLLWVVLMEQSTQKLLHALHDASEEESHPSPALLHLTDHQGEDAERRRISAPSDHTVCPDLSFGYGCRRRRRRRLFLCMYTQKYVYL